MVSNRDAAREELNPIAYSFGNNVGVRTPEVSHYQSNTPMTPQEREADYHRRQPLIKRTMHWLQKNPWKMLLIIGVIAMLAMFLTSAILQLVELKNFTKKANQKFDAMQEQIQKLNIDIFSIGMKVDPNLFPQGKPNPLPPIPASDNAPGVPVQVAPAAFRNKDNFASTPEYLKELNVFKGMGPSEQLAYMKMNRNEKLLKYGPLVR